MSKKFLSILFATGVVVVVVLGGLLSLAWQWEHETRVIFLSVGEGDAILVTRGSNQVLIDGGRDGKVLLGRIGRHIPFWDRTIETVIVTHPDADHYAGLTELFRAYNVGTVLTTGAESTSDTYKMFRAALDAHPATQRETIAAGTKITLPDDAGQFDVLFPSTVLPQENAENNTGSIVTRLTVFGTKFLFTGDLPTEETFLPNDESVRADVLKVAHHGSKYSSDDVFLDLVAPREAVVSVGTNRYGHPAPETLARLAAHHIAVWRTDQSGDREYVCREGAGCL